VNAIEESTAWHVEVWPIDRAELPRWVTAARERAASSSATGRAAAAGRLAERVEGNLLAADQEIKRLALTAAGREIDEAEVLEFVANNSRFDVFALADAVLAGETGRTFRILSGLRAEGVHPVQISWVLEPRTSACSRDSSTPCAMATISKACCCAAASGNGASRS
jgi:DNA polymerase-3 subunit delta